MGIKMCNKHVCQNHQEMAKKKKKREREKLLFYLLDNPTLEPNFKWQPLKVASLVLIWKWKL